MFRNASKHEYYFIVIATCVMSLCYIDKHNFIQHIVIKTKSQTKA